MMAALVPVAGAADVELISQGREVEVSDHLVPGKLVLVDFYADWCGPCRYLNPRLEQMAKQYPDRLAVRTVDVINWDSPVARQYGISRLPHLMLFSPGGDLLAQGGADRVMPELRSHLGGAAGLTAMPGSGRSGVPAVVWVVGLAVVAAVAILIGRKPGSTDAAPAIAESTDAESSRIWLTVVGGSLDGPFSVEQLNELRRRKLLDANARVRRRGDATWSRLEDVLGD
jgi:thioredoxin 1